MIEQLRKRFILSAMLSILAILICILSAIYGVNLYQMERRTTTLLDYVISRSGQTGAYEGDDWHGTGPSGWPGNGERPQGGEPVQPENFPVSEDRKFRDDFNGVRIDEETPYRTRFFSVHYSNDGGYERSFLEQIVSVTEEEAKTYGEEAVGRGKTSGRIGDFKYLRQDETDGSFAYYFLDIAEDRNIVRSNLISTVLVAGVSYILLFFLIRYISGRVVKPYADTVEMQKRFITDAGHELKTPLAIISANTDVIELTDGESEWTSNIRSQIVRLTSLIQRLLVLSRMEEGNIRTSFKDFSLSDAVSDTAEPFITLAKSGNRTMKVEVEEGLSFHGDERSIRELVSILCDNAVKYCDEGGEISVRLSRKGKKNLISVSNTCASLKETDPEHWFERFYRDDASRARETGGFGIGLSIARAVTDVHKGKITASYDNGSVVLTAEI